MLDVDNLKRHRGSTVNGIHVTAGRTKTRMTAERMLKINHFLKICHNFFSTFLHSVLYYRRLMRSLKDMQIDGANESALEGRVKHMSDIFQEYLMYLIHQFEKQAGRFRFSNESLTLTGLCNEGTILLPVMKNKEQKE